MIGAPATIFVYSTDAIYGVTIESFSHGVNIGDYFEPKNLVLERNGSVVSALLSTLEHKRIMY